MMILTTDWNSRSAPKSSLDRTFLKMTPNAYADGQLINSYISVRNGIPYLTNNLQSPPSDSVEKKTFNELLFSRVVSCKFNRESFVNLG